MYVQTETVGEWCCSDCGKIIQLPPPTKPPMNCPFCIINQAGELSLAKKAWNLTTAVASFVADGFKTVDSTAYQNRLEICESCDRRKGWVCLECGCKIEIKARGRAWDCPLKQWPTVTSDSGGATVDSSADEA